MLNVLTARNTVAHGDHTNQSTGPKTPEGKAASRMNALKHGLLSKEVLVTGESAEELIALHECFREDLKPLGPRQEMLVDLIVTTHWRLRRLLAMESGEMACEAELRRASAKSSAPEPALEESAEGCRLLQTWLSEALLAVEQEGELSLITVGRFAVHVGDRSSLKGNLFSLLLRQRADKQRDGAEEAAGRERRKLEAVTYIQENLRQLEAREAECHTKEQSEIKVPQTVVALPSAEALNKIIRYESMLNRQLFRANKELRSLQAEGRKNESENLRNEPNRQNPKAESRSENLPNEPIARSTVQGSEFKVQSSEEVRNEPISTEASEISDLRSQMDGNLPNEATEEGTKSEEPRILPNEPTVEIRNEEPRIKH